MENGRELVPRISIVVDVLQNYIPNGYGVLGQVIPEVARLAPFVGTTRQLNWVVDLVELALGEPNEDS